MPGVKACPPEKRLGWAYFAVEVADIVKKEKVVHDLEDHGWYGQGEGNQIYPAHNLGRLWFEKGSGIDEEGTDFNPRHNIVKEI